MSGVDFAEIAENVCQRRQLESEPTGGVDFSMSSDKTKKLIMVALTLAIGVLVMYLVKKFILDKRSGFSAALMRTVQPYEYQQLADHIKEGNRMNIPTLHHRKPYGVDTPDGGGSDIPQIVPTYGRLRSDKVGNGLDGARLAIEHIGHSGDTIVPMSQGTGFLDTGEQEQGGLMGTHERLTTLDESRYPGIPVHDDHRDWDRVKKTEMVGDSVSNPIFYDDFSEAPLFEHSTVQADINTHYGIQDVKSQMKRRPKHADMGMLVPFDDHDVYDDEKHIPSSSFPDDFTTVSDYRVHKSYQH